MFFMSESIPNDPRVVPGLDAHPSKLPLAAFKPASDPAYSGMVEANQKKARLGLDAGEVPWSPSVPTD